MLAQTRFCVFKSNLQGLERSVLSKYQDYVIMVQCTEANAQRCSEKQFLGKICRKSPVVMLFFPERCHHRCLAINFGKFFKKAILENTCEQVFRNIVHISTLGSLCIVFLYLTSVTKILNNTNKDRLLPHLPQNMECQARSSVSPLKLVLT